MTAVGGKKGMALCILEVLKNHSDPAHPLLIAQIADALERDFNMKAGRNAIARNLSLLRELGYEIQSGVGGKGVYLEPVLSDSELRVLMDSVLLSRYIPAQEARNLIDKLQSMGRGGVSDGMNEIYAVDKWSRTHNRDFFEHMEALNRAVRKHVQVRFLYGRIGMDGLLHDDGRVRQAHPLAVLCAQGQYYLMACYDGTQEIRHFRVDHITSLEVLELPACTPYDLAEFHGGVDMARYTAEHRYMFSGETMRVKLRMPLSAAGQVIDAFGRYAVMTPCADGVHMEVQLMSSLENMRIFALQYASVCEVLEPVQLRWMVCDEIRMIAQKYGM